MPGDAWRLQKRLASIQLSLDLHETRDSRPVIETIAGVTTVKARVTKRTCVEHHEHWQEFREIEIK